MGPVAQRVLVLAPHPDDETIGCGGTVALLGAAGTDITVVVATQGEASVAAPTMTMADTASRRRREAREACAQLSTRVPLFLDLPDGGLPGVVEDLAARIAPVVSSTRPDVIFAPWPLDDHPDHRAMASALARVALDDGVEIWCYEVWAALPANRIVDVTSTWETKLAALDCYQSGRTSFDLEGHMALSRWRSIFGLSGSGAAEAFLVLSGPAFSALVRAVAT
jgi:LmbE family N-acetylglucosaminyl deacetylase